MKMLHGPVLAGHVLLLKSTVLPCVLCPQGLNGLCGFVPGPAEPHLHLCLCLPPNPLAVLGLPELSECISMVPLSMSLVGTSGAALCSIKNNLFLFFLFTPQHKPAGAAGGGVTTA